MDSSPPDLPDLERRSAALDRLIAEHIQSLGSGRFFRRAEIEQCLDVIDPHIHVLVLTRYTPRTTVNRSNAPRLVHRLSFERKDGRIRQFCRPLPRGPDMEDPRLERYQKLLLRHDIHWLNPLALLIPKEYRFPEKERIRLQQHLNVLVTQTQIWRNIQKDHSISIVHEFSRRARRMLERPKGMTCDALCNELIAQFAGTAAIATRVLKKAESPADFSDLIFEPGPFKVVLARGNLASQREHIEQILNSETIQHLCKEALQRAKVIDATDDASPLSSIGAFSHFLILPFARSTNTKARRLELILLIDTDRQRPALSYIDVLAAQEIVPICDNVNLKTQGRILSDLTYLLSHLRSHPDVYWQKAPEDRFRKIAGKLSKLLVRATQAHSCTFRMIDAPRKHLARIASFDESGSAEKCAPQIALTFAGRSLNVFTYFNFQHFDGHCYVPIANRIPDALKKLGLSGCLPCRTGTQSEICFAIVHGTMAIGTINLESPSLRGFDDDMSFLRTVARLMASLYAALVDLYDSRFISERLSSLNHHHELKNYVDIIERLNKPFAKFLREKYLPGLNHDQASREHRLRHCTFTVQELVAEAKDVFRPLGRDVLKQLDIHISPTMPPIQANGHYRTILGQMIEQLVSNMIHHSRTPESKKSSLRIGYELPDGAETQDEVELEPKRRPPTRTFPTQVLSYGVAGAYPKQDMRIVMTYSINAQLDPSVGQNLGRHPVINQTTGKERFGFYILGFIARKLGGIVHPVHDLKSLTTRVTITVPMTLKDPQWTST